MDHGGCSLLVGVKDNKIVKVKGDPEGFLNKGYVCLKGLASPDRLTHPDRLKHPLKRKGRRGQGKWQRISWQDALEEIAGNLTRIKTNYGARSVAFGVGMPKGLEHFVLIRLANIFGSPNVVASQDVCHAPREITGLHTCGFYPVADFHHQSRLIILWGSNITSTNEEGELGSMLFKQIKNGAQLIVVDPRKTEPADRSEQWLQPRPGSDLALALGFLKIIIQEGLYDREFVEKWTHGFKELAEHVKSLSLKKISELTWVPVHDLQTAARMYARSKPAIIQWGNPLEHNIYTFDTTRALICLMAICGNLDIPGGNVNARDPQIMGLGSFVRADLLPDKWKTMINAFHHTIPRFMTVPPAFFKQAILEEVPYPVKGFFSICANPMLSYADSQQTFQAFMKLDFMAVADLFMTPAAAMADIVLPAGSQFEINDIGHYGLGHGYILARPQVVDPPEECWPDIKILNELGKLISPAKLWHTDYNLFLEDVLKPSGLTFRQFTEIGYLKGPELFRSYEKKGFRTPTGKVELKLSAADKLKLASLPELRGLPEEGNPDFPLTLTSSKSRYYLHSSYRWVKRLRKRRPDPKVEINPQTAAKHNIRDGDPVVIETRSGKITQFAHLTDNIDPRVINASHGWWFPEAGSETLYEWQRSNLNMLTSVDKLGKEFGTPNLRGIGCRIALKQTGT
jgi:anaerobic selenocysteine-containing dehydrogenase